MGCYSPFPVSISSLEDFRFFTTTAQSAGILLVPCFISFEFGHHPSNYRGSIKGGRADWINDREKGKAFSQMFLIHYWKLRLTFVKQSMHLIFFNEPEWLHCCDDSSWIHCA
jgi:hypothetical protein